MDAKLKKRILSAVSFEKKRILDFSKDLIRIPTVNPPGDNYVKIVSLLKKKLLSMGFSVKEVVTPAAILRKYKINTSLKRISLIARWDTGSKKTLHLNGHYDVVPVTSNWTVKPFMGTVKGKRLYGRGAEDMKSTIAAMLFAAHALKKSKIRPDVNIEFSFTPDEETGGYTGMKYLLDSGFTKPDYFVGEGHSKEYVTIGNKGMLWFEIDVKGKSAHASMPYRGVNSFEKMLEVADTMKGLKRKISKRKTRFGTKDKRDKFASMVMGGILEGGSKVNTVPDKSMFTIDRRLLPEETLVSAKKEILGEIEKLRKKDRTLRVETRMLTSEPPVVSARSRQFQAAFTSAVKDVLKKKARFILMTGGTDSRFAIKKGIPALGYSASGDESCHSDDEYVYVDSIIDTAKVFALVMAQLK